MQMWQRRILGVLAIGGGALGIAIGVQVAASAGGVLTWVLITPFLCLYIWGMWCGVCLVENRNDSTRDNLVFWAFQVPLLQSPYFGYFFTSGLFSTITFQPSETKWGFLFWLGSKFEISLMQAGRPLVLGINLFALAIAVFLYRHSRKAPPQTIADVCHTPDRDGGRVAG